MEAKVKAKIMSFLKSINFQIVSLISSVKILKVAKKNGALTIKRPQSLSSDQSTSESGWIHAVKEIRKKEKITHLLALQATSPIRGKDDLSKAINLYNNKKRPLVGS